MKRGYNPGNRRGYNEAKVIILGCLGGVNDWRDAEELARAIGWRPWSVRTYLYKLRAWGLLYRRTIPRVEYKITPKGLERLSWLRTCASGSRIRAGRSSPSGRCRRLHLERGRWEHVFNLADQPGR